MSLSTLLKKGALLRIVFITLMLLSLVSAWWLSNITSKALLPPLPNQQLDHFRLNRSLRSYLDNIDLLIQPSLRACSEQNIPILALVTSPPTHFKQREAFRLTWAKHLPTYFLMGLDGTLDDMKTENHIEAKQYGDIIIYNFLENYQNLTLKTALMLKWVLLYCPTKMLLKTDDDVFVNPWVMKQLLVKSEGRDLIGYKKMNSYLHRDEYNKWYVPRWLHRQDFIEEYLSGTGYMINGNLIKDIITAAYNVPMINLEDVFFTYLVAKLKLNLTLVHDRRLSPYKPWLSLKCYTELASAHSLTPEEMVQAWSFVKDLDDRNCEYFVNNFWTEWFLF